MAYIGRQLVRGQNRILDDISSSFNGSTTAFNLTVSSTSSPPASVNQLWIILGGVLQKPGTDFTVADAVITFTTAPASTLSFWGMIQGDTSDINAPSDASVTPSKIANSGDFAFPADVRFNDADGSHYVGLQAPSTVSSNLVWTLPAADGSANQLLKTDGSGALGWATDSATDSTKMPLAGGTFTGDVIFTGDAANLTWDKSTDDLIFNDNAKAIFGTGNDLEIFHDGDSSYINHVTSGTDFVIDAKSPGDDLILRAADDVEIRVQGNESAIKCIGDGSVELFYNDTKRFETSQYGIEITGAPSALKATGAGECQALLGSTDAGGAGVYFDGDSNGDFSGSDYSWIKHNTSGDMEYMADAPAGATNHVFKTQNGNAFTVKSDKNVEIHDGDLIIGTSGHGIDFSASSNQAGVFTGGELLADYEAGLYTPVALAHDGSAWQNATLDAGTMYGSYVKIGNMVHVQVYGTNFHLNSSHDGQLAGFTLPITADSGNTGYSVLSVTHENCFSSGGQTNFFIATNTARALSIQEHTTSYNTWSGSSGRYIMFAGTYRAG